MQWRMFTWLTMLFLASGSFAATQPQAKQEPGKAAADQVTDEDRKFEGTWGVVCEVFSGVPGFGADAIWTFTGKRYIIKRGNEVIEEGIQHLNPTKQPKEMEEEITVGTSKGKREHYFYEINGDACTLYFLEKGKPRPTKLESTLKGGYVIKLRRTKPPGPVPYFNTKPDPTEKNAAVLYQRALDIIPTRHDLYKHESKLLDDWETAPLNDATAALLEPALLFLRHAATVPTCKWNRLDDLKKNGPVSTNFISALVPARALANAVCLRARYLSATSKPAEALEELINFLAFVRRLDGAEVMVLKVPAITLERIVLQQLALHAAAVKGRDALRTVLHRYDALPSPASIADVLRGERVWWQAWLTQSNMLPANSDKLAEWTRLHETAVSVAASPYADRPAAVQALDARVAAARPLLGQLADDFKPAKLCSVEDLVNAERHLFPAGLTVLIGGPQELQKSKDPFSGRPFEQRRLTSGFELTSALKTVNGEQVKLVFGQATNK